MASACLRVQLSVVHSRLGCWSKRGLPPPTKADTLAAVYALQVTVQLAEELLAKLQSLEDSPLYGVAASAGS